ncbi:MAG: class I SAM-dependent methyltransferase [Vicinamibacterales bacterium]
MTDGSLSPLVCPHDGLCLEQADRVLACPNGHQFPVRAGIPRIVTAETGYTDSFGEQWNRYRTTQLDSYTKTTISLDRLKQCLGPDLWEQLSDRKPTTVLEAGCGAGRFTEVLLQLPGPVLTSTDLSAAVDANLSNCPASARHRVVQCDINELPFRPESYDLVLCLGVIQHTPDPEATIDRLYRQTKPGGWLAIDHYTASFAYFTKVTALILRPILKRLPPERRPFVTERLVRLFLPFHLAAKGRPFLQHVVSRFSPVLTYYHTYPALPDDLQYEWALVDTHDSLTDHFKHFRSAASIAATLARLGAAEIWVQKGGNGVEARCRKPL